MSKRIRIAKAPRSPKREDTLIELRPGVYLFTPYWAIKKGTK